MKTRTLTTLVLFLYLCSSAGAQVVFPLRDAIWEEQEVTLAGNFIRYRFTCGDTLIRDSLYAMLYTAYYRQKGDTLTMDAGSEPRYTGGLRSEGPRVYYLPSGDSLSRLLYDFSIAAEEILELPPTSIGNQGTFLITAVDTIQVNGTPRRRLFIENVFGLTTDIWIEGIGSIQYGLLDRGMGLIFDYSSSFRCFRDNADGSEFVRLPAGAQCYFALEGCPLLSAGNTPGPVPAPYFSFFPNPTREWLTLDLVRPLPPGKGTLRLVDYQGRPLRQWPLQPALDLRGLPAGLYLLRLDLDGQILQTARLLVSP